MQNPKTTNASEYSIPEKELEYSDLRMEESEKQERSINEYFELQQENNFNY